ncbi:hypothetical protein V2J09_016233, partial [Rumex salicifolius]
KRITKSEKHTSFPKKGKKIKEEKHTAKTLTRTKVECDKLRDSEGVGLQFPRTAYEVISFIL